MSRAISRHLPGSVVHADWGTDPRKRRMARASLVQGGRYRADRPVLVPPTDEWTASLLEAAERGATIAVGFDFPIGLPEHYAAGIGASRFLDLLPELGSGRGSRFFDVAEKPEEISLERPFYPSRPGGTRQIHLTKALGASEIDELRRRCERQRPGRRAASPLFWTLGAQQVGKAAISGWREVLIPLLAPQGPRRVSVWPFDGPITELLRAGQVVVCETYPAEFYSHLGVVFPPARPGGRSGKRVRADRARNAGALLGWMRAAEVEPSDELEREIADGFGERPDGEDRFDAVVGLLGMLGVLLGYRPSGEPSDPRILATEGWILGLEG